MHMHERNTGLPSGWMNKYSRANKLRITVDVRACLRELIIRTAFRSALLRGSSRISSITRVRHVNTCSRRLPIPGAISFVKLVLHTQGKIDCYVVGFFFFFFVILMSNLMAFCFYYVHVLNFMRVFMNLFIYANFHFHGSICLWNFIQFCNKVFILIYISAVSSSLYLLKSSLNLRCREFQMMEEQKLVGTRV